MRTVCATIFLLVALVSPVAVASAAAQSAAGGAPTLIPISGALQTPTGEPRTGTVLLVLSLYEGGDDDSPRWVEYQYVTLDAAGKYDVQFGTELAEGLPADLFSGATPVRWVGVAVENEPEQPRMMLVGVPYASKATTADTLAGKPASDFVLTANLTDQVKAVLEEERSGGGDGSGTNAIGTANVLQKSDGLGADGTTDSTVIEVGGNVGIGTPSPLTRLQVTGGMVYLQPSSAGPNQGMQVDTAGLANGSNGVFINAPTGWTGQYFKANLAGIEQFGFFHNGDGWFRGSLGIGTNVPNQKFHLLGGMMYLQPSSSGANQGFMLDTTGLPNGSNALFVNAPGGWTGNYFKANAGGAEQFAITQNGSAWFNGSVGIGTASPSTKLHVVGNAMVSGNVTVDGNIAAKYQDVAEWVDAVGPLEPGTVVIIDETGMNRVMAANGEYDLRVAGAVSPQPGLVLGEPGEGRVLVAQSGRVRIKVDARYGAIKPGDLVVSSPTRGHAMRSTPVEVSGLSIHRPGTVIGKALEPLASGTGEILVLLTLQ